MKNYAYITLLSSDDYLSGVLLLHYSLERCNTQYPLYCMVTENISDRTIHILEKISKINIIKVPYIDTPEPMYNYNLIQNEELANLWKYCFTKFHVFNMTQFDKVIFLDADLYFLKNTDHVFEYPHMTGAVDGEAFSLWLDNPHLNTGFFVVEPSEKLYNDLLDFINTMTDFSWLQYCIADQEIINYYYKDWPSKQMLHLDAVYNVFAGYLTQDWLNNFQKESLIRNAYFLHFVGPKPWQSNFYDNIIKIDSLTEDLAKARKMVSYKTAIYAICKNEIQEVDGWIENTKDADYIVILDTGSTDGTYELLQQYQEQMPNRLILEQKIFSPWRFDVARNYNMQMIPKDVEICISIDFDERLTQDWYGLIQKKWYIGCKQINYKYEWCHNRTFWYGKVHSPENWVWKYPVHEYILYEGDNFQVATLDEVLVSHYAKPKDSRSNYLPLLELRAQEFDDLESWTYLAHEYFYTSQYNKCIDTINNIIFKRFETQLGTVGKASLWYFIGNSYKELNNIDKAIESFDNGIVIDYTFRDNFVALGKLLIDSKNDFYQAIQVLQNGLLFSHQYYIWLESPSAWGPDIYTYLSIAYYNIEKYDISLIFANTALEYDPQNEVLINNCTIIKNKLRS